MQNLFANRICGEKLKIKKRRWREGRKEGKDFWREGRSARGGRLRSLRDSHTRRLPRDPLLVNNSLRDNGRAAASRVLLSLRVGDGRRLPPGGTVRLNVGAPYATPMPPQTETPLLGLSSLRISRCNRSGCGSSSSSFSNFFGRGRNKFFKQSFSNRLD